MATAITQNQALGDSES
ncbi:hypothetical protein PENSOL_c013G11385 [Penicillium solitum]|uniref:Uncharacterized protein n=1 Tax=Penicillium solitum TaxID=60172 RepID=A0A1V6R6H7_9EURO|nr:hypothetical protein PENSOL_c013G11385 [Penicillium solitum]